MNCCALGRYMYFYVLFTIEEWRNPPSNLNWQKLGGSLFIVVRQNNDDASHHHPGS